MGENNKRKKNSRRKRRQKQEELLRKAKTQAVQEEAAKEKARGAEQAARKMDDPAREAAATAESPAAGQEVQGAILGETAQGAIPGEGAQGAILERESEQRAEESQEAEKAAAEEKTSGTEQRKLFGGRFLSWKQFSGRQKAGVMAAGALGVLILGYAGMAWQYQDKLLPGTTVNQVACGQMNLADTEALIREQVEDYSLKLLLRDGQEAEITPEMIDYHYVPDGSVEKILEEQNIWLWLPALFTPREYQVAENIDFDRELLGEFVDSLPQAQADQVTAPADAQLVYQEGGFVIQPEVEGNQLKIQELKNALEQAVLAGETEISAEELGLYEAPATRQDSQILLAQKDQLNQLANASITYQMPGGETLVLDGNTLRGWLLQDEAGNYYKDESVYQQCLDTFVKEMESRIDNVGAERTFRSTNYGEYTLSGGSYGWMLSRAQEKEQLKQELAAGSVLTREPVYKQKGVDSLENGGIGNTYVEIDMSNQHMWFYQDGVCVLDSDVVTGTMVRSRYTPEGIYYLYFKQRNRVLRGQIVPSTGKPEYETPVAYWMPFNGGIGLHDADWNSYFGGQKYIYSGSHGCINLPSRVAGKLYSMIEVGTPVICYYPEGYSLHG